MSKPAVTFEIDHDGSVVRIVGNQAGLNLLINEMATLLIGYRHGATLPLGNPGLCIARGGTDIIELVCDDKIQSEGCS